MTSACVPEMGDADNIEIGPLPVPTDVLVCVEAVAVNPTDALVRSGAFAEPHDRLPTDIRAANSQATPLTPETRRG